MPDARVLHQNTSLTPGHFLCLMGRGEHYKVLRWVAKVILVFAQGPFSPPLSFFWLDLEFVGTWAWTWA